MDWYYQIESRKDFDSAVQAVSEAVGREGFRVLHVHDVQATFKEKGVAREPYKIVETCNVRYASKALQADPLIGLMMPCRIVVFAADGVVRVALSLPSMLATYFPDAGLHDMAEEVEAAMRRAVDAAS